MNLNVGHISRIFSVVVNFILLYPFISYLKLYIDTFKTIDLFTKFYVHGTVHLSNTSFIKYQRDATFSVYLFFYNSTCFGGSFASIIRSNLQTVVTATGVYHRCGVE